MLEIFERGGLMMYPLALASLILVAIIIERFIMLRKKKTPLYMECHGVYCCGYMINITLNMT